jgi:hypothetical protein
MAWFTRVGLVFAVALVLSAHSDGVKAQATRTWVSGVGDDANPCSRTAPCKTFAGAISKTAAGGEINCLDPAGYGAVTITKSITIDCEDTQGSILASAVNGININDSATAAPRTILVKIRGLSINGAGTTLGINGINFTSGAKLFVDEVFFQNFSNAGININANGADVVVRNSSMVNTNIGFKALSTTAGAGGIVHVTLENVNASQNNQGIRFEGNTFGVVKDSVASANTINGFVAFPVSIGGAEMNIMDSTANNNRQIGVFAGGTGQSGVVRIFNLTAFHNTTNQLQINAGGSILSNGRNHIGTPTNAPGPFTDQ